MTVRRSMRITAAAIALAVGFTGAAQAESFNIFSASRAQAETSAPQIEQARYRGGYGHRRGINPGAAVALGTMGLIAGAAIASRNERRYYCDPDYEYCGRRVHRRYRDDGYYAPRYYAPRRHYYYD